MRNFTQLIRGEEETRLDIHCYKLNQQESKKLSRILKDLGFTFCYVKSDSILAFLTDRFIKVKGIMEILELCCGFGWTGDPAIIGVSESELDPEGQNFPSGPGIYFCKNCRRSSLGWAESNICPECGGKLVLILKS